MKTKDRLSPLNNWLFIIGISFIVVVIGISINYQYIQADYLSIKVSPEFGKVGESVEIQLNGLDPDYEYLITFGGIKIATPMTIVHENGYLKFDLEIPSQLIPGQYSIVLSQSDNVTECQFDIISPEIVVSPAFGMVGSVVSISARGLVCEKRYNVALGTNVVSKTTDKTGAFKVNINVPSTYEKGKIDVLVYNDDEQYEDDFEVISPSVTINPAEGRPGTIITLEGSGFRANTAFNINQHNIIYEGFPEKSGLNGEFKGKLEIPQNLGEGYYSITVIQGESSVTETFEVLPKTFLNRLRDNILLVIIGFVLGMIIIGILVWFLIIRSGYFDDRYLSSQQELAQLKRNFSVLNVEVNKAKKELIKYKENSQNIHIIHAEYTKYINDIKTKVPKNILSLIKLFEKRNLPEDSSIFTERLNSIKIIGEYYQQQVLEMNQLRDECIKLIETIKHSNLDLYNLLYLLVIEADLNTLPKEKALIEFLINENDLKEISPEIKNKLLILEKSVDNIRDYSFRLVPKKLIKLGNELANAQGNRYQNQMKEKIITEIINLINEYLTT